MSGLEERFPALWHLLGGYLHQDYDWTGTIDENIDLFVSGTPDLAPLLPAEVDRALAEHTTEEDLEAFVEALGCQVLPPDDLTHRAWLSQIAEHVRAATGQR